MAETYSNNRQAWIDARYQLIDEVLEYRRTGVLSQSLLDACDAEFEVASWAYSEGIRRMAELAQDGHAAPASRLAELRASKDWRVRYEAIRTGFDHAKDPAWRRELVRLGLADRSFRIRSRMASEVVFAHLIDMVGEIEQLAGQEPDEAQAKDIFDSAFHLRLNEKTGEKGQIGGTEQDAADLEKAWERFKAESHVAQR